MFDYDRSEERTGVQESADYGGRYDVQSDFVMIYGIDNIKKRAAEWKKHGYKVDLMTGVAWGGYQDYLYGRFDGRDRHDEGQLERGGSEINHGVDIPYMVPSIAFADYLIAKLKPAVDAGIDGIYLEEPEFWTRAGYSEAFKREWRIYYREEWSDPQASCDAQYRASKLKQYLYTRTLDRLCSALKEYAMTKYGRLLRFYVPTHSLINYSQWMIVSPESALLDLPSVDGYIAQIWTGTARSQNMLRGKRAERTFMTAFLEYGVMQELVRGTGRRMWFLADPIEDNPGFTWSDYRVNYFRTVTASLFHPEVSDYEVAPWPRRVFNGSYPKENGDGSETMPEKYRTEVLSVMQTLRCMKQSEVKWRNEKSEAGVLIADSAMFQRIYPEGDARNNPSLPLFNAFYGLSLPLLERGYAVRPVQLDNIRRFSGYLASQRALALSYEFMKPQYPDIHNALAGWVNEGGALLYAGDGSDGYHAVREWWNTNGRDYADPAQHLFEALGLGRSPSEGIHTVGKGFVYIIKRNPASFAESDEGADVYTAAFDALCERAGIILPRSAEMALDRGPYTIAANPAGAPFALEGKYIDLYEASLPVLANPIVGEGECRLFYNLEKLDRSVPAQIIAIAARPERLKITQRGISFRAVCAQDSTCTARIYLKRPPKTATIDGNAAEYDWDADSSTLFIKFANSPEGTEVRIGF